MTAAQKFGENGNVMCGKYGLPLTLGAFTAVFVAVRNTTHGLAMSVLGGVLAALALLVKLSAGIVAFPLMIYLAVGQFVQSGRKLRSVVGPVCAFCLPIALTVV